MGRDRLVTNCIRCWEVVNSKILSILKKASNECSWNTSAWTATSNFKICYWILLFNKRNFMSISAKKNETQYRMVSAKNSLILHFSSWNCSQPTNKWIFVNQTFFAKNEIWGSNPARARIIIFPEKLEGFTNILKKKLFIFKQKKSF